MRKKNCHGWRLLEIIGICVVSFFPLIAQDITRGAIVTGTVRYPSGQPVTRVPVKILRRGGEIAAATTDEQGQFRFDGLPRAILSLTVSLPSQMNLSAEPVFVDTSVGGSFTVDIFLRDPMLTAGKKKDTSQVVSSQEIHQQIPKEARKAFSKAQKFLEKKELEKSLAELDRAVQIYPDYFQAFTEKGVVHIQAGRPQNALEDFAQALHISPSYAPALSGTGYSFLSLGKYEEAIGSLEKAIYLDPGKAKSFLFLGIANLAVKRWQKAQEVLEQSLKIDPTGVVSAHIYLAEAFAGQREFSRAAAELRSYLDLNPQAPNTDRLRKREEWYRAQRVQQN